jgi:hypothetical protein
VALGAIVVAAISFGIVDVSIADADGCVGVSSICTNHTVPPVAISFAALGALSILVSILPTHHDVAIEQAVLARRRTRALVGDDRF